MKFINNFMFKALPSLLLLFLLLACNKKVESIQPTVEKITYSVYASGIIKSNNQYQVYAKVTGIVSAIFVKDGDMVKKGQAILKLSDAAQKLNYENAKLLANFSSTNENKEKLIQAQSELEVAKLKMENEASLYDKQKKLWAQDIGSKNELDQRELSYKNAMSIFNAAKLRSNDLQKQINFQSEQTQKTASISSSSLNDFVVKSEINGRLYSLSKEKGEMVNSQSPIAIIGDANEFYVELQVDEYDVSKLKIGQKVFLTLDSYKGEIFEAAVSKLYPIMNEKSKSFKVEAVFTKKPANLYPNLTTEANIVIEVKENVLTIPRNYLIDNEFVLLAGKEKRKVVTGLKDYEKVEIISGITAKDAIFKPE
jgi:multidrug efflux pump subunit AcrA (membrane-fusion protein)